MFNVFYITAVYFLVGAVFIFLINKRSAPEKAADRWVKYGAYLLIVHAMIYFILQQGLYFYGISVFIAIMGLYELCDVWRISSGRKFINLFFPLLVYLLFSYGLIAYSEIKSTEHILFVYVVVFTFDGFSQITGQLFGKRKLTPAISPAKTVAGFIGGTSTAVATAFICRQWTEFSYTDTLLYGFMIALAALGGDLLASYYKRVHGVKDYSNLIPGHGGILDRFDSFIAAGAVWSLIHFLKTS